MQLNDNLSKPIPKLKLEVILDPLTTTGYKLQFHAGEFTKKDVVFCTIIKRLHLFTEV